MRYALEVDERWLALPVREAGDAGDWAAAAVQRALSARGLTENDAVRHLYVQTWAAVTDQLRERADLPGVQLAAAWGLLGQEDLLPLTVAELALHLLGEPPSLDVFVEELVADPEERFSAPDVTELETGAGTAVRIAQLRLVADAGETEVQTSVVYVWPGPSPDTAMTLTAWFSSPVDSELSRPLLDDLAGSLSREPG